MSESKTAASQAQHFAGENVKKLFEEQSARMTQRGVAKAWTLAGPFNSTDQMASRGVEPSGREVYDPLLSEPGGVCTPAVAGRPEKAGRIAFPARYAAEEIQVGPAEGDLAVHPQQLALGRGVSDALRHLGRVDAQRIGAGAIGLAAIDVFAREVHEPVADLKPLLAPSL